MKVLKISSDYEVDSNNIQIETILPVTLTFDFLQGGEVVVNNISNGDVNIIGKRPVEGASTFTIAKNTAVAFFYDGAEYRTTAISLQGATTRGQVETITSPSASDVGKVWFATAEGEASFQATAGTGDMLAAVYDPTNVADDAFARANHTGTQSADTITDGTVNKAYPATDKEKVDYISVTQAVDLDQIETDVSASKSVTDNITVTQAVDLDQIESDTADNTTDIDKSRDSETVTGVTDIYTLNCESLRRKKFDMTTTTTNAITINLSNVTQANTLEAAVLLIATAVPATITHPTGYSYATSAPTIDTAGQEIWFLYDKNKGDTGGSIHWAWKVETP